MVAAVQALENRGYIVKNSEELIEKGIKPMKKEIMLLFTRFQPS